MLIRGEAGQGQILTGVTGNAEEIGLYGVVRGLGEVFHQIMALSYLGYWWATGCGVRNSFERNKIRGR